MPLKTTQSVAPSDEPVSRDEARLWMRVTATADDSVVDNLIVTARDWAEALTRRQFVTATWVRDMDGFPPDGTAIVLPHPPLSSITSISYIDENGSAQTWASAKYQDDTSAEPGCVLPVEGETYPSTQADTLNTVTVTYQAGYGDPVDVPQQIKTAILMYVEYLYDRPGEPALKNTAEGLLRRKYQVGAF